MIKIHIGDKVVCTATGVVGTVLSFYNPTSCEEQTMVETEDGRKYHAPTIMWEPYMDGLKSTLTIYDEVAFEKDIKSVGKCMSISAISESVLEAYDEYVIKIALTHGLSLAEAHRHPMCKTELQRLYTNCNNLKTNLSKPEISGQHSACLYISVHTNSLGGYNDVIEKEIVRGLHRKLSINGVI